MLRGSSRTEVFAAIFFEARRDCAGGYERDAHVFAAGGGGYGDAEQEATCGAVSARGGGRIEHHNSLLSAKLLPASADDCDSAATARRRGCGDRFGWIFRFASEFGAAGAAVSKGTVGDCACGGIA